VKNLPDTVNSIKRFLTILIILVAAAVATVILYSLYIEAPLTSNYVVTKSVGIVIIIAFGTAILLFIRRGRPMMERYIGDQPTTIFNIFVAAIAVIVMMLAILNTLGASAESLLTGAGFASITIGVIISTFVGGILAGALVFATHRLRVGDTVVINSVPGTVTELTALVTRIRTDVGYMTVPNSAIASGTVIITRVHQVEQQIQNRLPYIEGDRVVTTYLPGEGIVQQLTALRTVILMDDGKEITLLNSSILSGGVAVAKIVSPKKLRH
jgi:small-conductance mechanosensitive channel